MELLQAAFQEGRLMEEAICQAVVLIPKGGGEYCGMLIVEVVWKVVMGIINCCFTFLLPYTTSSIVSG